MKHVLMSNVLLFGSFYKKNRNVCLYLKISSFSLTYVSGHDVMRWIFGTNNKGKLISSNDITSGNFDSEKVDQAEVFYSINVYYISSSSVEWSKITHTKNHTQVRLRNNRF
jgi:hypothetical protein